MNCAKLGKYADLYLLAFVAACYALSFWVAP